jgi:hypothetical protein
MISPTAAAQEAAAVAIRAPFDQRSLGSTSAFGPFFHA